MHRFMWMDDNVNVPMVHEFVKARETYGREAFHPSNQDCPFGSVATDCGENVEASVYRVLNPREMELMRLRFCDDLIERGWMGRSLTGRMVMPVGEVVVSLSEYLSGEKIRLKRFYRLYYRVLKRPGGKVAVACDMSGFEELTAEIIRTQLPLVLDAFPTFMACLGNVKAQVPGLPTIVRAPDSETKTDQWTLFIETDVPAFEEEGFSLSPEDDWPSSKLKSGMLLALLGETGFFERFDEIAFKLQREVYAFANAGWLYRPIKVGLKHELDRVRNNPLLLTLLILRPTLGVFGSISDHFDLFHHAADTAATLSLHSHIVDAADLFHQAEVLGKTSFNG